MCEAAAQTAVNRDCCLIYFPGNAKLFKGKRFETCSQSGRWAGRNVKLSAHLDQRGKPAERIIATQYRWST